MRHPHGKLLLGLLCSLLLFQVAQAQPAPDFTLPTEAGPIRLQDFHGKVVYLDFWASWCLPCRHSFPWMNEMQERYGPDGLVVLAVNVDKDGQELKRFLDKYSANFTVAFDPQGGVAELYGLKGMPTSYLIDRQGNIAVSHLGFRRDDAARLEAQIQHHLTQAPQDPAK